MSFWNVAGGTFHARKAAWGRQESEDEATIVITTITVPPVTDGRGCGEVVQAVIHGSRGWKRGLSASQALASRTAIAMASAWVEP